MNFPMTLGLVMVLVGYATAGFSLSVERDFHPISHEDENEEDIYGEPIEVRRPIMRASYLTSAEPVYKTESSKQSAFKNSGDDKSNVHQHNEEKHGGPTRVARGTGNRGQYEPTPQPQEEDRDIY